MYIYIGIYVKYKRKVHEDKILVANDMGILFNESQWDEESRDLRIFLMAGQPTPQTYPPETRPC